MKREELLSNLFSAWYAIVAFEGYGDIVGAKEYWEGCSTDELQREWDDTVDRYPEYA